MLPIFKKKVIFDGGKVIFDGGVGYKSPHTPTRRANPAVGGSTRSSPHMVLSPYGYEEPCMGHILKICGIAVKKYFSTENPQAPPLNFRSTPKCRF